jgi:hypothetical protein
MSARMQSFHSSLLRRVICRNVSSAVLVALVVSIFGSARIAAEDLTLEQAIRTAQTHRAELRGAENLVESAQGLRKQATAHPNPRVVYQSENLRPGMDFSGNVDTYAYASQVLEISGKRGARIGLAQTAVFVRTALDRFEVRPVRTSDSIHGMTVIAEGLRPGENIVTRGGFLLKSQMLRAAMQGE